MKIDVEFNLNKFVKDLNFDADATTMLALHNMYARRLEPYVPFLSGTLNNSVKVTSKYILYPGPYAHYMYEGIVYGPNFPIKKGGVIIGWKSPKGKGVKKPTSREIVYTKSFHPLATAHWDKVAMQSQLDPFIAEVRIYLLRRFAEKNG